MNPYEPPEGELRPPPQKRGRIRLTVWLFVIAIGFAPLVHEHFQGRTTLAGIIPAMATLGAVVWIKLLR